MSEENNTKNSIDDMVTHTSIIAVDKIHSIILEESEKGGLYLKDNQEAFFKIYCNILTMILTDFVDSVILNDAHDQKGKLLKDISMRAKHLIDHRKKIRDKNYDA